MHKTVCEIIKVRNSPLFTILRSENIQGYEMILPTSKMSFDRTTENIYGQSVNFS